MTKGEAIIQKFEKFKAELIKDMAEFNKTTQPVLSEESQKQIEIMREHIQTLIQPVKDLEEKIRATSAEIAQLKSDRIIAEANGDITDLKQIEAMIDERLRTIQKLEAEIKGREEANNQYTPAMFRHKAKPMMLALQSDSEKNAKIQEEYESIWELVHSFKAFFTQETKSTRPEQFNAYASIQDISQYIIPGTKETVLNGNSPGEHVNWQIRFYQAPTEANQKYSFFKNKK